MKNFGIHAPRGGRMDSIKNLVSFAFCTIIFYIYENSNAKNRAKYLPEANKLLRGAPHLLA
ncbi:hypothetical protein SCA6_002663 [Theobroma cacao]